MVSTSNDYMKLFPNLSCLEKVKIKTCVVARMPPWVGEG